MRRTHANEDAMFSKDLRLIPIDPRFAAGLAAVFAQMDDREKRLASPAFAAATKAILMELDKLEARKDAQR